VVGHVCLVGQGHPDAELECDLGVADRLIDPGTDCGRQVLELGSCVFFVHDISSTVG
jgi:hypothetical protein